MNENVIWHNTKVSYENRCQVLNQKGQVIWFTGLSGSGKSTIAVEVEKKLSEMGKAVYLLDGDNIRLGINSDLGFSDEDRNENIRRIAEIAALFKDAGIIVLASFISPFEKMREYARERAGADYFTEIYVKTSIETCMKRDPKGLYKKKVADFTGIGSGYEEPVNPDIIIDTEKNSVEECVEQVLRSLSINN